MTRTIAMGIFVSTVLCLQGAGLVYGTTQPPEDVLRMLFKDHQPPLQRRISFTDKKQMERYFTPELIGLFLKDADCVKRTHEVCGLEGDPIYDSQDSGDEEIPVTIAPHSPLPHPSFEVTFVDLGRKETLIYELLKTKKGWRVSNIVYPDGGTLKKILGQP